MVDFVSRGALNFLFFVFMFAPVAFAQSSPGDSKLPDDIAKEVDKRVEERVKELREELEDEYDSRLDDIENEINDESSIGRVNRIGGFEFTIGGFSESCFAGVFKEGGLGGSSYTRSTFPSQLLALHLNGQIGSRFSLQNTLGFGNVRQLAVGSAIDGRSEFSDFKGFQIPDPAGATQANNYTGLRSVDAGVTGNQFFGVLFIMTGTYEISPELRIKIGQMPVAFADSDLLIHNDLRRSIEPAQYVRPLGLNMAPGVSGRIITENMRGIELNGTISDSEEMSVSYAAYVGQPTFSTDSSLDWFLFGSRAYSDIFGLNLQAGFSYQHFRQASPVKTNPLTGVKIEDQRGGQLDTLGLDFFYSDGDFEVRNEFVFSFARRQSSNKFSAYVEPAYRVLNDSDDGQLWVYARLDFYDDHTGIQSGQLEDATDYKLGAQYFLPVGEVNIQVRLEYTYHDFKVDRPSSALALLNPGISFNRRDYHLVAATFTVTF